jgi:phage terminase large subunit|nr:MAG TPA: terminase large subunit [Caudoviricetes sp.]
MVKKLNPKAFNPWVYKIIDDYSRRIEVYYGGAGSGKSYGALQKVLLKSMKYKRRVLITRKVGTTIKDSVWCLMLDLITAAGLYDCCEINKADREIKLPNGSVFLFKGLDDPEKIKSITGITDIVLEEASEFTEEDFTQLNLRLRPKEPFPQLFLMFNPVSKANWVFNYFFSGKKRKNTVIYHTTYKDNKFLSKDYKKELENLKERNPAYYRIYALGEFATLDKLVFPAYTKRLIGADEVAGLPLWIGLDFGYINDPSALVWGRIDTVNKKIYVMGEYVRKGMKNNEIADTMITLGLHKDKSYADCAEPKSIDEIKDKGVNIEATIKGKDSIIFGLQWMLQYEIIVDERCFKVAEELENYTWKKDKKTGEYVNEPVDTFNHTIDAMRYGLNKYIKGTKTPKVYRKPVGF